MRMEMQVSSLNFQIKFVKFFSNVLNHSTLKFRDFSKKAPVIELSLEVDRRIFERCFRIIPHDVGIRIKMLSCQVIGGKLVCSRDMK